MRIAVTGATGTLGRACIAEALGQGFECTAIARGEDRMAWLHADFPQVRCVLGDIRDTERMTDAFFGCDYVIHCAALKRVEMYEHDPRECVSVNVAGTQSVLDAAAECEASVLTISTDKAVCAVSLYGMTKAIAERLTLADGESVLRLGNVYGSTGSVTEIWARQVAAGQPITITDPGMGRWFCRATDAAEYALAVMQEDAGRLDIIPGMVACTVGTLAEALYPGHPITVIGARAGERTDEVLATAKEAAALHLPCAMNHTDSARFLSVDEMREWIACCA